MDIGIAGIYLAIYLILDRGSEILRDRKKLNRKKDKLNTSQTFFKNTFLFQYIDKKVKYLGYCVILGYSLLIINELIILFLKEVLLIFLLSCFLLISMAYNYTVEQELIPRYMNVVEKENENDFFECFGIYKGTSKFNELMRKYYECSSERDEKLQEKQKKEIFEELPY